MECLQVRPKQQEPPAVLQGKKPQTSEALWGNSRGGWAKSFKLAIHFRHNHTEPSLLFH